MATACGKCKMMMPVTSIGDYRCGSGVEPVFNFLTGCMERYAPLETYYKLPRCEDKNKGNCPDFTPRDAEDTPE